jgi:hypothetical protein
MPFVHQYIDLADKQTTCFGNNFSQNLEVRENPFINIKSENFRLSCSYLTRFFTKLQSVYNIRFLRTVRISQSYSYLYVSCTYSRRSRTRVRRARTSWCRLAASTTFSSTTAVPTAPAPVPTAPAPRRAPEPPGGTGHAAAQHSASARTASATAPTAAPSTIRASGIQI